MWSCFASLEMHSILILYKLQRKKYVQSAIERLLIFQNILAIN